ITHHAPRITHHAPRITHHAPRITHHASRTTHHAPRITHHAPRHPIMPGIPNSEIIIIGGGAVGCGVAYALAKAGKTDVLLLERAADLGQATTSQGAGLCG